MVTFNETINISLAAINSLILKPTSQWKTNLIEKSEEKKKQG